MNDGLYWQNNAIHVSNNKFMNSEVSGDISLCRLMLVYGDGAAITMVDPSFADEHKKAFTL